MEATNEVHLLQLGQRLKGTLGYSVSGSLKPCFLPHAAALQALKRKKRYEKQLAQIDGTLSTIEFQREALENANTNTEVLKNMGYAAKAMKAAHDNMYVATRWWRGGIHMAGPQSQDMALGDPLIYPFKYLSLF